MAKIFKYSEESNANSLFDGNEAPRPEVKKASKPTNTKDWEYVKVQNVKKDISFDISELNNNKIVVGGYEKEDGYESKYLGYNSNNSIFEDRIAEVPDTQKQSKDIKQEISDTRERYEDERYAKLVEGIQSIKSGNSVFASPATGEGSYSMPASKGNSMFENGMDNIPEKTQGELIKETNSKIASEREEERKKFSVQKQVTTSSIEEKLFEKLFG